MKYKKRVFEIIEKAKPGDKASKIFDIFIMSLIFLSVLSVILETVQSIYVSHKKSFLYFEIFSVIIFTIEYTLRIWSCTVLEKFKHPFWGRIKFALSPLLIIDLLAIIPFYLPMLIPIDLRFLRALRFTRIFRMFKMGRYSASMKLLGKVVRSKKEELQISMFMIGILLIIASSLIYFVEHKAQPEIFSSIPAAMWWGVATLTTVGYGDVYPVTPLGKLLGAIIAILGIGMFALPAGILASGFIEEIQKKELRKQIICPHCGQSISNEHEE